MGNKYLVDANIFITAYRRLYPFDLAPSFWEQLIEKASHRILIIEQVDQEIRKGKDVLSQWYLFSPLIGLEKILSSAII